ncbi:GIY-YIG nuclease family protein [Paenibacillus sp. FSL H7-0331]|uniref:GIY-YIG nuclease family protein n=1 Tax=Paenibacillus sp. FSL H7-0331 TaxID=1920421 RepID=UPI00096C8ABD|nr:GIY-YIG nuclease family protein [Paenibacillus sp. FSL H7-0331]OME94274.1 hypothetical protein BK127_41665 [Paenibacillus sp. FSL H7-0331]
MNPEDIGQRYIYVIQLENENVYVGQTPYLAKRLDEHKRGKASKWSKIHKYEYLIDRYDAGICTSVQAEILENETVLKNMKERGWRKVRGGHLSAIEEKEILRVMIKYRDKYKIDKDYFDVLVNELDDDMKIELSRYIQ